MLVQELLIPHEVWKKMLVLMLSRGAVVYSIYVGAQTLSMQSLFLSTIKDLMIITCCHLGKIVERLMFIRNHVTCASACSYMYMHFFDGKLFHQRGFQWKQWKHAWICHRGRPSK